MATVRMSAKQIQDRLAVLRKLVEKEFPTRPLDDRSIAFDFAAGPIPIACYCEINPTIQAFIFRGVFSMPFEPAQRPVVSEYLHRVNYSLPVGNWAIDLDSGEVRWKSGLYFGDSELTEDLMYEAVGSSLHFIRQHVPGLVKLSVGRPLGEALRAVGEDHGEGVVLPSGSTPRAKK
jgi:hypothetical protein